MPLTNAQHQAAHRTRQANRLHARTETLRQIIDALEGNDRAMAGKIRALAEAGLGETNDVS